MDLANRLRWASDGSSDLSRDFLLAMGWTRNDRDCWINPAEPGILRLQPNPTVNLQEAIETIPGWKQVPIIIRILHGLICFCELHYWEPVVIQGKTAPLAVCGAALYLKEKIDNEKDQRPDPA